MLISKYIFLGFQLMLIVPGLFAKKSPPVTWSFEIKDLADGYVEITARAAMSGSWVIYSQNTEEDGPIPTSFLINGVEDKWEELSKAKTQFDEMFEVNVSKFEGKAIFRKKIKKENVKEWIVEVEFMTCDGEKCLPPDTVIRKLVL